MNRLKEKTLKKPVKKKKMFGTQTEIGRYNEQTTSTGEKNNNIQVVQIVQYY